MLKMIICRKRIRIRSNKIFLAAGSITYLSITLYILLYFTIQPQEFVNDEHTASMHDYFTFPNDHVYNISLSGQYETNGSVKVLKDQEKKVSKVILLAYLRGGSSFLGQLFASNPEAFYWFEIVQPMYQAMFGMMVIPYEILYTTAGFARNQSQFELDFIFQNLEKFYSCDLGDLPLEMLYQETSKPDYSGSKWENYHKCIKKETGSAIQTHLNKCVSKLPGQCRKNVATAFQSGCHIAKGHIEGRNVSISDSLRHDPIRDTKLQAYYECLHSPNLVSGAKKCANEEAKEICRKSKIRSAKILRLRLEDTEEMVKRYPDIKVIHQLRDPRGTLISAKSMGLLTSFSGQQIRKEAKLVCDKMFRDARMFQKLAEKYPDNYLQIRYEDFADDPIRMVKQVYNFLNEDIPGELIKAVADFTNSSFDSSKGSLGTHRKNSSATAHKWRKSISKTDKTEIDKTCEELLNIANYSIL